MSFQSILQVDSVQGKSGPVPVAGLEGKVLMLYFSAHWCPPCRGFTPRLANFYTHLKANGADIVFVSSDKDEKSFDEYYGEMPWLALPFADRDGKARLSKQFNVSGIPTLVILKPNGETLTTDGRDIVDSDPTAAEFPWSDAGASVVEILEKGPALGVDLRKPGSFFALYFSAHWCGPCRDFTPKFAETYNKVVAEGKPLSVIFASSDEDEESFQKYHASMPWLALPFKDPRIAKLTKKCGVDGIPHVAVFDHNGEVVNPDARGAILKDPFPWAPVPLGKVASMDPEANGLLEALNEKICALLVVAPTPAPKKYCGERYAEDGKCACGGCDGCCGPTSGCACPTCEAVPKAATPVIPEADVTAAVQAFTEAGNASTDDKVQYIIADASCDPGFVSRVGNHLSVNMTVSAPVVIVFNLPAGNTHVQMDKVTTSADIAAFVAKFAATQ